MYLNRLKDTEKLAFMSFARKIQQADGDVSSDEEVMIQGYYHEMNLFGEKEIEYSITQLINLFKDASIENKNIIIFEGIGLAYADGVYSEQEKELINNVAHEIGLTDTIINLLDEYVLKYMVLVNEIDDALKEKYIG